MGAGVRLLTVGQLRPGVVQFRFAIGDLLSGVVQFGFVVCNFCLGVIQFYFVVCNFRLGVIDLLLGICQVRICSCLQFLIAQLRPLLGKGLQLSEIGGLAAGICVCKIVDTVQQIAVNIGGGVTVAVVIGIEGVPRQAHIVFVGAEACIAGTPHIKEADTAVHRDVDDGGDRESVPCEATVLLQCDGVAYANALLLRHVFFNGGLIRGGGQGALHHNGLVDGVQKRPCLHQYALCASVQQHRVHIAAFHGLHAIPGGNGVDILLRDAVCTGDLQGFQIAVFEILICPLQDGVGGRLKAMVDSNAHRCNNRHRQKGDAALPNAAQQVFSSCLLHYHTNPFAAAGWRFTMTSATTPPFMRITRLAILAISSLWVTMSMVVPARITSSRTVSTSMLVS